MRRTNTRRAAPRFLAAAALFLLACSAPAIASLQTAQQMLQRGQTSQALEHVDKLLASNPKDRSTRFLRGVILAEMNRLNDAIAVFTALTAEAPELPEPYNNLAVIYAQQKQYDKAKAALEMSIRTHPTYAIAHENLGDLYTQMARQAYDRALQIDAANTTAQSKLKLLREINGSAAPVAARAPTAPATLASAAPVSATPVSATPASKPAAPAATPNTASASKPVPSASAAPTASAPLATATKPSAPVVETSKTTPTAPAPAAAAKPAAPAAVASAPVAKPSDAGATAQKEADAVRQTVLDWAKAWSARDVKAYLAFYAKRFDTPGSTSRSAWEAERRDRVSAPSYIKVGISDMKVDVDGDRATARFRQSYASSTLKSTSGKTLVMIKENGRWQIQQEKIGR